MRGAVEQQFTPERNDDGEKEKKKKRRSNRRSRQNATVMSPGFCGSINEISGEATECVEDGRVDTNSTTLSNYSSLAVQEYGIQFSIEHRNAAHNVAFRSLPSLHTSEQVGLWESQKLINQNLLRSDAGGRMIKSCPEQIAGERISGKSVNKPFLNGHLTENSPQKKYFASHWSKDETDKGLQKGDIFKALFRVNAHNRVEAYCKIDGLPIDVFISGIASQNRAVEGDIVAVKVDSLTSWTKMKGTNEARNNLHSMEDTNLLAVENEKEGHSCKGKKKIDADFKFDVCVSSLLTEKKGCKVNDGNHNGDLPLSSHHLSDYSQAQYSSNQDDVSKALGRICTMVNANPSKRPTGRVVAILERSQQREAIVGHLNVKLLFSYHESSRRAMNKKTWSLSSYHQFVQMTPNDPRFPMMMVNVGDLPDCIMKRLDRGDVTVESELVAVKIIEWVEESYAPRAHVLRVLGRGSEVETNINAILFENAIHSCEFSHDSLSCIPHTPWEIPSEEFLRRRDLRNLCIFTIDPSSATDLDDALSVEKLANGIFRVGVHIADVSYFVLPDTALDKEAQLRSTSVYLLQRKIPMLPPTLSDNVGSLNPGVDRLAFSLFLDIDHCGDVKNYWIGRTVLCSCCKLSYKHAQDIIEGLFDSESSKISQNHWPQLHGQFVWLDVITGVKHLNEISRTLKEKRFRDGALQLESSKITYLYDEYGIPYDSMFCERKDSECLVEEFMLLANTTVAEVISRTFPNCALLRRHPEPIMRKLREFELFCSKHGFELDTSSSVRFQQSLEQIKIKLHDDPLLFDILISYATKPMQLATYFCSGELKDGENGSHYALGVPLYTHFTSPLRRYPDIVVHRTLAAVIEAEELYLKPRRSKQKINGYELTGCLTDFHFDKEAVLPLEVREALNSTAVRHGVPCTKLLSDVAAHCNNRKLASKHVKDACDKLYMWTILKKKKILFSGARVLGLGPRFMSVYIHQLAIERRIHYDEVEGFAVEWLDATSTLVLNFWGTRRSYRSSRSSSRWKALEEVAFVVSPCDLNFEQNTVGGSCIESDGAYLGGAAVPEAEANFNSEIVPAVFPLTVRVLSTIPVAMHAIGGDDGPIDIGVRLYMSSYLS